MKIDVPELVKQVLAGDRMHIARALTLVESSRPDHREKAHEMLRLLAPHTGNAIRVGISGVPGAGKSTFINKMGCKLIDEYHCKIAVLAVDPSSSRTGGSILGDRTRMGDLANRDEAFVRPSPSGGHLGGVARATREAMIVMEAAGYGVVIIETVGVGQSEVAVAGMVDTFLMLAVTGTGDQLQGIKKGILELADVVAVNKADGDNAGNARVSARDLSIAMKLVSSDADKRRVPVLTCSAYTGSGLDDVWQAVLDHRAYLEKDGSLTRRRISQQREWLWNMVENEVLESLRTDRTIQAAAESIEAGLGTEATNALDGASQILQLFAKRVPDMSWAHGEMHAGS
ncbi:methylmalonyl Co-A mutase-associated GTPase MeaB [Acidipropionibacterium jensenii]|uniref:methylmalonyl Co-A mutase-associated GTPase MeaB n=1 Tax=Acidipropionibacterium jensenii TaxID=1749 RepID=UPI000BC2E68A|nr:methylmalonyl Co-A mutase-associated GTPase MeaB [Acidipropionibacterium jensenii]AZZ41682.1 methylmalonyl Co-A mutase-associated GTPase MeaB [Acidipropionibacterium jensenii]